MPVGGKTNKMMRFAAFTRRHPWTMWTLAYTFSLILISLIEGTSP